MDTILHGVRLSSNINTAYTHALNIDKVVEQKYLFTNLSLIMNILKKTKGQSVDFKVPMIREGILDIINHICTLAEIDTGRILSLEVSYVYIDQSKQEETKEKASLPTVDYINSQISSSRPIQYSSNPGEEMKEVSESIKLMINGSANRKWLISKVEESNLKY